MENFFHDTDFCSDLDDFINSLQLEDEIKNLPDNFSTIVEMASLEKVVTIGKDELVEGMLEVFEQRTLWFDRFPEEGEDTYQEIKKALTESIDIVKFNQLMPELYYPNGKKCAITKQDLIDYEK